MTLDAVARLMLDEAGPLTGRVLVMDDAEGALTSHLRDEGVDVVAYCDDLRDADALPSECRVDALTRPLVAEVDVVLIRLDKSLGALEDQCSALAGASEGLRVVAGGRVKHMTPAQNEILARSFANVRASLGRQKCRVLHASGPLATRPVWPKKRYLADVDLTVWSFGSTFSTNKLDAGTSLLVRALKDGRDLPAGRALDLGCGSGILACLLARAGWQVEASDVSAAAVASTRLTAQANGVEAEVEVVRRDGLVGVAPGSLDLIVTNPAFHRGAAKDSTPTLDMIADAGTALAPGGEVWCVFNSHLPYLPALASAVGPTRIVARDRHYTVIRSVRAEG